MLPSVSGCTSSFQSALRARSGSVKSSENITSGPQTLTPQQGFDEFMNLVIDDAVEVKQITKTNDKESRKPLGKPNGIADL